MRGRAGGGVEGERRARVAFHEDRQQRERASWEFTHHMRMAGIQKVCPCSPPEDARVAVDDEISACIH